MPFTIFYSWQSDSPASINRNFIEEALKKAIKEIEGVRQDFNVENAEREVIIFDKDTKGIPGQPNIAETILKKISACNIFVPDLTFVGESQEGRLLMNPNVLIEYGWGLNSPSRERYIAVMNTAFGDSSGENLPFDMRYLRRPLQYHLSENADADVKRKEMDKLVEKFVSAIKLIIKLVNETPSNTIEEKSFVEIQPTSNPSTFLSSGETLYNDFGEIFILPSGQRMFLRLIPETSIEHIKSNTSACKLINDTLSKTPLPPPGCLVTRNKHGACVYSYENIGGMKEIYIITQLFLNKELWGIDAGMINRSRQKEIKPDWDFGWIPSAAFEIFFSNGLKNFIAFAKNVLNLPTPLKIIAGATSIQGYKMIVRNDFNPIQGHIHQDNLVWTGAIENYENNIDDILKPCFEYFWDAFGLNRTDYQR